MSAQSSGGSRISRWGWGWGGGADPLGGANLQRIYFLAKTYAKMKEMDPVGGRGVRRRRPPGSANAVHGKILLSQYLSRLSIYHL